LKINSLASRVATNQSIAHSNVLSAISDLTFVSTIRFSAEPLQLDPGRLKTMLENYSIDGHPVFDRSNPTHQARLEEIMAKLDSSAPDQNGPKGTMETCQSIKSRTQDLPLIADDNMGEEWQRFSVRTFPRGIVSMFRNLWKH
jgi:hypothetical protein